MTKTLLSFVLAGTIVSAASASDQIQVANIGGGIVMNAGPLGSQSFGNGQTTWTTASLAAVHASVNASGISTNGKITFVAAETDHGLAFMALVDQQLIEGAASMGHVHMDIQSASDSIEQVFGWKPSELQGKNVKVLIPEPKRSSLDRYLDRYRNADHSKTLHRTRVFDAVRKDGKPIQMELSMSRAELPSNMPAFFIGIIRDVSNMIVVGTDLNEERTRLQRLVTEQTKALATANLRLHLADHLASLGTLAAGLGHDMNSVLLPVRSRLNAMEHAGISAAATGHLTAVRRSVAYLQQLSDGLHFLAVDSEGRGASSEGQETTNIAKWWNEIGLLLRKLVPSHVKLHASIPPRLPEVVLAPHWLTQAMLNLIVNPERRSHKGVARALCACGPSARRMARRCVSVSATTGAACHLRSGAARSICSSPPKREAWEPDWPSARPQGGAPCGGRRGAAIRSWQGNLGRSGAPRVRGQGRQEA